MPLVSDGVEDQIITLPGGRRLAYAEYGDAAGVPLIYLHGWPSSRLQGRLLHELGVQHGLRVISPDRPGIGLSDAQPERTLLDWPKDVAVLADTLGFEKFHIMGVSGGGPYTLATAYALPERLLSASIVAGAPSLLEAGTHQLMWPYRMALWVRDRVPSLLDSMLKVAARVSHCRQDQFPMSVLMGTLGEQDKLALARNENYSVITEGFRESLRSGATALRTDGNVYSSAWGFDPADIKVPLFFWHGGEDKNIPLAMVEKFVKRIPTAQLTIREKDGHYSLPLLRGEEVVQAVLGR